MQHTAQCLLATPKWDALPNGFLQTPSAAYCPMFACKPQALPRHVLQTPSPALFFRCCLAGSALPRALPITIATAAYSVLLELYARQVLAVALLPNRPAGITAC